MIYYTRGEVKKNTTTPHEVECEILKRCLGAFCRFFSKEFFQVQTLELGDQQKGFVEISQEILGEFTAE